MAKAERLGQAVFEAVGHPALLLDPEHHIIAVNKAVLKATGLSEDQLIGQNCSVVFHGTQQPPEGCPLERLRTSGRFETVEMEIQTLGGTYLVSCTPLLDAQGRIEKILHVATDVTGLKKARLALEQEKATLEAIFEASPSAIVVIDPLGRITRCNQATLDLHGFASKDQILGRPVSMLVASQHREALTRELQRDLRGEDGQQSHEGLRRMLLTSDCQEFPAEASSNVVRNAAGEPIAFVAVAQNIAARETAEKTLQASEERYRVLVETIPYGVQEIDAAGTIVLTNPALDRMLGYERHELAGRKVWTLEAEDPERLQAYIDSLVRHHPRPEILLSRWTTKGGDDLDVQVDWAYKWDTKDHLLGFITIVTDITERKRAEEHIRRLNRVYAVLSDVNQAIVRIRQPQALFEKACRIAVEQGGFRMAWVGLVNDTTQKVEVVAHAGEVGDYLERLDIVQGDTPRGRGPTGVALREGGHAVCNDIAHDPRMAPWREDALRLGYRSSASLPLATPGWVRGTINLYASEPDYFDEEELRLLDEMAMDISFAMEFAEKDSQRRLAGEELRQLASRHEAILSAVPEIIMEVDANKVYTWANPTGCAFFGDDVIGREAASYFEGEQDTYDRVKPLFNGDPNVFYVESWQRRKDGQRRLLAWWCRALKDQDGRVTGALSTARDITEALQAEQALRDSELRYRRLLELAGDAILVADAETGLFVEANQKAEELLGIPCEQIVGMHFTRLHPPEEVDRYRQLFQWCVEHPGAVLSDDLCVVHREGHRIPVEISCGGVMEWAGRRVIQGIFRNVTERKRVEQKLKDQEARLQSIFLAAPIGIGVVVNRVFKHVNDYVCRMTGYSPEELLDQNARMLYPSQEEYERVGRDKYVDIQKAGIGSLETRWRRKDGTLIDVLLSSAPLDPHDWSVGVTFTALDITERKRTGQALRESEERFHLAIQGSDDGLWDWPDVGQDRQWWSSRFYELLGCQDGEIEATNSGFNGLVHPEDLDRVLAVARTHGDGGKPFDIEYRLRTRSGEYRWFSSRGAVVRSREGRPIRMSGSIRDITDRHKAQADRAAYQAKLRSLTTQLALAEERERRRIAVGVHDDIGQKLVMAKLELQSFRQTISDPASVQGIDHICNLIDQTMQDARSLAFDLSNPVLYEVGFDAAVESWLNRQIEKKAAIQCDFASEMIGARLDETMAVALFQAVREVLTNVVKHAQAKTIKVRIRKVKDQVRVTVEDDGVGFDPAILDHPTESHRGLGLFNVKERIEYLKGRVEIRSQPGQGTCVTLTVPFKARDPKCKGQEAGSKK